MTGPDAEVGTFIHNLKNYTQRKELAYSVRNDGSPLTGQDLATIAVVVDIRLVG